MSWRGDSRIHAKSGSLYRELAGTGQGVTSGSAATDYPPLRRGVYALGLLMLVSTFSYLDRGVLSLLVIQLHRDLGLSDTQIGGLQGIAFALFYTTLVVPVGWFADRAYRPAIIATGVAVWSLSTVLSGLAHTYPELFVARMGVGAGEACLLPPAFSLIADYFPPRHRGLALGAFMGAGAVGTGLATTLAGMFLHALRGASTVAAPLIGTVADWQATLLAAGLPGLPLALLLLVTVKEAPRRGLAPRLEKTADGASKPLSLIGYVRAHPTAFISVYSLFALVSFVAFSVLPWAATVFIRRFGATPVDAGLWLGPPSMAGGGLGCIVAGALGDHWTARESRGGKLRCALTWWLTAAPIILLLLFSRSRTAFAIGYGLFGVFGYIGYAAAPAVLQEMAPGQLRGRATALWYLTVGLIGFSVSPSVVPLIEEGVFHSRAALMPAIATATLPAILVGGLLTWFSLDVFDRARRQAASAQGVA